MLSDKPGTQGNMRTCLHCCLYSTVFFSRPSRDRNVFLRTTELHWVCFRDEMH